MTTLKFQRADRLAHAPAVGQRVHRIRALDQHRAKPLRMVREDLLRNRVARHQAHDDPRTGHRAARRLRPRRRRRATLRGRPVPVRLRQAEQWHEGVVRAGPGVVARQEPHQPVQVTVERGVQVHLHAEVLDHRDAAGTRDPFGRPTQQRLLDAAGPRKVRHGDPLQGLGDGRKSSGVLVDPLPCHQSVLNDDRRQGREAPRIGARTNGEVEVRHLGRLAAPRVDDDHGARGVVLNLAQDDPCAREAVGLPGVLADEHGHLAVLEVAVDARAHHLALHPRLAGLLLRERVGAVLHAQGLERGVGISGAQVVSLAAAAVVQDALAAVAQTDGRQLLRDFANGRWPVDGFVGSVRAPSHRRVQPVGAVLVVVHALGLLADVSLRHRMGLVAPDAHDSTTLDLHLQAAVQRADDAGGLLPDGGFRRAHA